MKPGIYPSGVGKHTADMTEAKVEIKLASDESTAADAKATAEAKQSKAATESKGFCTAPRVSVCVIVH